MILDDLGYFRELDTHDMRRHLDSLPDQVEMAFAHGQLQSLPDTFKDVDQIVIAGMGSSAVAGDLLAALVSDSCHVPILICRGYDLPAFVEGQRTLLIALSPSGTTEETLNVLVLAQARQAQLLVISMSDSLAQQAQSNGATVWKFDSSAPLQTSLQAPSRAVLGWTFGLLVALITRLGLAPDFSVDLAEAVEAMRGRILLLGIEGITAKNPAKRLAGQLIGRFPVIYGSGIMAPVARRWKTQLNENGKTWAEWDELPEINHNATAGIIFPRPLMTKVSVVVLSSPQFDHPRVAIRQTLTKDQLLQQGIAVDVVKMRGNTRLSAMLGAIQYGDYVSYYVAMCYQTDPTPTPSISELKERLANSGAMRDDSHD